MAGGFAREGNEFGRGVGFFDAIYGFAITLLVANLDLPPAEAWQSVSTLFDSPFGEQLLAFAISFVVIAVFWKSNTNLLSRFRAIDSPVIAANLVGAGFVVLIPFSTQGISEDPFGALPLPTALYAVNVSLVILAHQLIFEIGCARGLLVDRVTPRARWAARVDVLAQVAVFVASIPIAFLLDSSWARTTWAALIVISPLTGRWSERVSAEERERVADEAAGSMRRPGE